MANVTFNLPAGEPLSRITSPGTFCKVGVGVMREANAGERFEARVVITATEAQLLVSVNDIDGTSRDHLSIEWVDLLVDPASLIEALEQENKQLRDRVHELERSAGLRS